MYHRARACVDEAPMSPGGRMPDGNVEWKRCEDDSRSAGPGIIQSESMKTGAYGSARALRARSVQVKHVAFCLVHAPAAAAAPGGDAATRMSTILSGKEAVEEVAEAADIRQKAFCLMSLPAHVKLCNPAHKANYG